MSHGGSDASEAEADLTPLLDLVLQLLMFFIINVNFVTEQVNPDIKLPTSESARPIDNADLASLKLHCPRVCRFFSQPPSVPPFPKARWICPSPAMPTNRRTRRRM